MYTSQVVDVKAKNWSDEQVFVYEVLLPSVSGGRVWLKVPRHRMSEKNRQISLLGGKIITILPITSQSYDGQSHLAWWVKITTYQPRCLYFFGPFTSVKEAQSAQNGYIDDLQSEGALDISVEIKYCQPRSLTIELS